MITVSKRFRFDASHILPDHEGACKNLHGHTYTVLVQFTGELNDNGMVIDFGDIKAMVEPVLDAMDHSFIIGPDTPMELLLAVQALKYRTYFMPGPSTAEFMAEHICSVVGVRLIAKVVGAPLEPNISFITVRVYETPDSFAEVTEELPWGQTQEELSDEDMQEAIEQLVGLGDGLSDLFDGLDLDLAEEDHPGSADEISLGPDWDSMFTAPMGPEEEVDLEDLSGLPGWGDLEGGFAQKE